MLRKFQVTGRKQRDFLPLGQPMNDTDRPRTHLWVELLGKQKAQTKPSPTMQRLLELFHLAKNLPLNTRVQLTALWGTLHWDPKLAVSNFRCSKAFIQHSYQLLLHIKNWEPKARPKSHTFAGQHLKTTSSKKHKPYPSPSPQPTTSQKFITYCRLGVWDRDRDFVLDLDRLALLLLLLLLLSFLRLGENKQTKPQQGYTLVRYLLPPWSSSKVVHCTSVEEMVFTEVFIRKRFLPTHCKGSLKLAASPLALF